MVKGQNNWVKTERIMPEQFNAVGLPLAREQKI